LGDRLGTALVGLGESSEHALELIEQLGAPPSPSAPRPARGLRGETLAGRWSHLVQRPARPERFTDSAGSNHANLAAIIP
jgi:hypothetical protein